MPPKASCQIIEHEIVSPCDFAGYFDVIPPATKSSRNDVNRHPRHAEQPVGAVPAHAPDAPLGVQRPGPRALRADDGAEESARHEQEGKGHSRDEHIEDPLDEAIAAPRQIGAHAGIALGQKPHRFGISSASLHPTPQARGRPKHVGLVEPLTRSAWQLPSTLSALLFSSPGSPSPRTPSRGGGRCA